jgi:hypothetical protein
MQCASSIVRCSPTNGTGRTLTYSAGQAEVEAVAGRSCPNVGQRQGAVDVCTNTAAFGLFGERGLDTVTFANKCQYQTKDGVLSVVGKMQSGGALNEGLTVANRIGCRSLKRETIELFELVVPVKKEDMCPVMGHKAVKEVDSSTCVGSSQTGRCVYDLDTIAGGCATKECVQGGIETFTSAVRTITDTTALTGVQRVIQDTLLAGLLDGLRTKTGACGQPGKTCLARLDGECGLLFDEATEFQRRGRSALYEGYRRAGELCVAEAGERDR